MTLFRFPYAMLIGILIAFTALIPIFGAFIGCVVGTFLILVVDPMKGLAFIVLFLVLQQIEGESDLSSRSRELGGAALYLGAGGSDCGRQSDGCCGYADLHTAYICCVRAVPPDRLQEIEGAEYS